MDKVETLLQELTDANGVSGFETEVRKIMYQNLAPLGEISYDRLGSIFRNPENARSDYPSLQIQKGLILSHDR